MSDLTITISKDKKILNNHLKYSKQLITRKWQIYNSFKNKKFFINWTSRDENSFYFQKEGGVFTIGDPLFNGFLLNKKDLPKLYNNFLNNNNSFLKKLDGMYIIFFIKKNKLQIANSLFGSRNLFYYKNDENTFISTNQFILKRISNAKIDLNGIAQRACFHTNYDLTFLKNTKRLKHDKILKYEKNKLKIIDQNRLKKIHIKTNKFKDIKKTSDKLNNINYKILKKIFYNQKKILLSLSGGRDSRYVLANIIQNLKSKYVKTFSIGNNREDEVRIAKEVCKINKIKNKLWTPKKIYSMRSFEKSLWDSGVFDITLTYKNQITKFLKSNYFDYTFIETNLIEIFLDDRKFHIEGNNSKPELNFIYSRKATIKPSSFSKKLNFISKTEKIVRNLFSEFNFVKDKLKKSILFDAAYVHSPWNLPASLTQFYTTNKIVSLAENKEIVSFIMNIDNKLLNDSKLYDFHNFNKYPNFFSTVITRDIDYRLLNYIKFCILEFKNLKFINHVIIKNGALFTYLNLNTYIFNNYLKKNEKLLKKIFDEKFISWVQKSHEKGIPTSRVYKLICLIFKKNWIRLYDVLIPMSVIATLKNFEKFPYKKIKPRNINIFNY